ncbi:MAG: SIS domain-containing protein [candidate division Zixibacteria bacterium]|nr:SIS domain-containing protein [candidate division Zixibacteria bacterium]MCI0596065.1 SIS domain-containing protein [candidate division Zixibacteria bacterium]
MKNSPPEIARRILADSIELRRYSFDSIPAWVAAYRLLSLALNAGKKVLLCGNGGSAADGQHFAAELVVRLRKGKPRAAQPAVALATDSSILTAAGNDLGFEKIFSRQVEALGVAGDVLIAISTSGTSANVVEAARAARKKRMKVIALTGKNGGKLGKLADSWIAVPSADTQRIQEMHITILHFWGETLETVFSR